MGTYAQVDHLTSIDISITTSTGKEHYCTGISYLIPIPIKNKRGYYAYDCIPRNISDSTILLSPSKCGPVNNPNGYAAAITNYNDIDDLIPGVIYCPKNVELLDNDIISIKMINNKSTVYAASIVVAFIMFAALAGYLSWKGVCGICYGLFKKKKRKRIIDEHTRLLDDMDNMDNISEILLNDCCICQAEMTRKELLLMLSCEHVFHRDCINQWLDVKAICPLCQKSFSANDSMA